MNDQGCNHNAGLLSGIYDRISDTKVVSPFVGVQTRNCSPVSLYTGNNRLNALILDAAKTRRRVSAEATANGSGIATAYIGAYDVNGNNITEGCLGAGVLVTVSPNKQVAGWAEVTMTIDRYTPDFDISVVSGGTDGTGVHTHTVSITETSAFSAAMKTFEDEGAPMGGSTAPIVATAKIPFGADESITFAILFPGDNGTITDPATHALYQFGGSGYIRDTENADLADLPGTRVKLQVSGLLASTGEISMELINSTNMAVLQRILGA